MVSSQILQFDRYPLSSLSEIRRPAAFVIALVRFNPTAKIIVFLSPDQVFTIHGITPRDVLARRVPVSAFCRYRVSLQRKKCCQQIIGLNDEWVFRAVRSPNLLLRERQVLSSRISIARWKQWEKLSRLVVRAAAANSNKGLLIGIWPRITSGFTSNWSVVHLLKSRRRVADE